MVKELTTAAAALLGVLIGGLLNFSMEKKRQRISDETRFHDYKRELYARFLTKASETDMNIRRAARTDEDDFAMTKKVAALYSEMLLISSTPVLHFANKLLLRLQWSRKSEQYTWSASGGEYGMKALTRMEFEKLRGEIVQSIRSEFGFDPSLPKFGL